MECSSHRYGLTPGMTRARAGSLGPPPASCARQRRGGANQLAARGSAEPAAPSRGTLVTFTTMDTHVADACSISPAGSSDHGGLWVLALPKAAVIMEWAPAWLTPSRGRRRPGSCRLADDAGLAHAVSRTTPAWLMPSRGRRRPGSCRLADDAGLAHAVSRTTPAWLMPSRGRRRPGSCRLADDAGLAHAVSRTTPAWLMPSRGRRRPGSCRL